MLTTADLNKDPREAVAAAEAVEAMVGHSGWDAFQAAVEARKGDLVTQLLYSEQEQSERLIGEIKGLEYLQTIVDEITRRGDRAANELRAAEYATG